MATARTNPHPLRQLFLTLRYRPPHTDGKRVDLTTPAPDKINVHEIVDADTRRHQSQQRSQQDGPAVLPHHLETQQINVTGQFPEAAGFASQLSIPGPKPCEEFILVPSPGNLGKR